jgi:rSAM/selenodomain-associated transferase 2
MKELPISLIIPTLNEKENFNKVKKNIELLNSKEVLIIDGNSSDKTISTFSSLKKRIIISSPSRGVQLHLGAQNAKENWFLFMHADTLLNNKNIKDINQFIKKKNYKKVGYFKIRFDSNSISALIISYWAYIRTVLLKLPFGDQCILIHRNYYQEIGGFSPIPIMEDLDFILKIPKKNKVFFNSTVQTSFRNYQENGVFKQCCINIISQIKFLIK